jgi:hypothetical protein
MQYKKVTFLLTFKPGEYKYGQKEASSSTGAPFAETLNTPD